MPADLRVEGVERLERAARQLREAGDKDLRREMYRAIQRSTKPLRQKAKEAALRELPQRGGLNVWVASSRFSTKTRGGGRNPGVRITATKGKHNLKSLDEGKLRHPVFGNRNVWVSQPVPAGWFSKTIEDGADEVRKELVDAIEETLRKLSRL